MTKWKEMRLPLRLAEVPPRPGVYVFFKGGKVEYVGSTVSLKQRFGSHKWVIRKLGLERVKFKLSEKHGDWLMWEYRLILKLRPRQNLKHVRNLAKQMELAKSEDQWTRARVEKRVLLAYLKERKISFESPNVIEELVELTAGARKERWEAQALMEREREPLTEEVRAKASLKELEEKIKKMRAATPSPVYVKMHKKKTDKEEAAKKAEKAYVRELLES